MICAQSPVESEILGLSRAMWDDANTVIIDATYSGRAHQILGTKWNAIDRYLGVPAVVISTFLAGGAGITALTKGQPWITATLAISAAALSAARSFLRPNEKADLYGSKGDRMISLVNDARRFQDIDLPYSNNLNELREKSQSLSDRRNALREELPHHIPTWAYDKAKKSIANGESEYQGDPLWREPPR